VQDDDLGGLRATRQRRAVLSVVEDLGVFSGARAVHEALEAGGHRVGLSTVYRSLHALAELEFIDSIRGEDGETLYRKCAGESHQHLLCRHCGTAEEFSASAVKALMEAWVSVGGYRDVEYVLEMYGTCPSCAFENDNRSC
jgi:Fur family ferric uptake transcriptional regulator